MCPRCMIVSARATSVCVFRMWIIKNRVRNEMKWATTTTTAAQRRAAATSEKKNWSIKFQVIICCFEFGLARLFCVHFYFNLSSLSFLFNTGHANFVHTVDAAVGLSLICVFLHITVLFVRTWAIRFKLLLLLLLLYNCNTYLHETRENYSTRPFWVVDSHKS